MVIRGMEARDEYSPRLNQTLTGCGRDDAIIMARIRLAWCVVVQSMGLVGTIFISHSARDVADDSKPVSGNVSTIAGLGQER